MEYQDYFVKKGLHQKRQQHQIPSFGNWDCYDDMPVTQYFESARPPGLVRKGAGAGADAGYGCGGHYYAANAELSHHVLPSAMHYDCHRKTFKAAQNPKHHSNVQQEQGNVTRSREQRRQVRVCDAAAAAAYPPKKPKAVDEDLYKIPPELLCQQRRPKKVSMGDFWRCCLGLNGVA